MHTSKTSQLAVKALAQLLSTGLHSVLCQVRLNGVTGWGLGAQRLLQLGHDCCALRPYMGSGGVKA